MAISLVIITPLWMSCLSDKVIEVKTVVYVPDLYFPTFPKLQENICIPLDENGNRVNDEETEIMYYLLAPHYLDQLVLFKSNYDVTKAQYMAAKKTYSHEK